MPSYNQREWTRTKPIHHVTLETLSISNQLISQV